MAKTAQEKLDMAEYYLPEGTWTSLLTGEEKEGGKWYREKHGYLSIPLYVKEGSIVAMGSNGEQAVYDYEDGVNLQVYAVKEGQKAQTCVYNADNEKKVAIAVAHNEKQYDITVIGGKNVTVTLMNTGAPVEVCGADYTMDGNHLVLQIKEEKIVVKCS